MSKRSERREAERAARKLAYQELRSHQKSGAAEPPAETVAPAHVNEPTEPAKISEAQLIANRANAQLSSGPTTPAGKAVSSRNALKTGLTGRTVLLPTDDTSEYNRRLEDALARHRPATTEEQALVQSIVDIEWRLDRAVTLETGIYAKGGSEFADKFDGESPAQRKVLIQTETYLKYEKSLRNLNIQEARLQRQRTKILAELKRLKEDRAKQEAIQQAAQPPAKPALAAKNGFEFSTCEFAPASTPLTIENSPSQTQSAVNTCQ